MDGSLRELERRARGSADAADVHAYLQALVRADAAPADRAPLLAWLAAEAPPDPDALARGLAEQGRAVVARGALAAAEALLDVWLAHAPPEHAPRVAAALAAARAWLACPCDSHAADAQLAAEAALVAGDAVRSGAIDDALAGHEERHEGPPDDQDLDVLDPELTRDPRAAFDEAGDAELLARLRRATDAGEPLDDDLVDECRERAGEEAVLEATTGALRGDLEEVGPLEAEPRWRRDGAEEPELRALDRQTHTVLLVDPVAMLAAAAAAACNAGQLSADDRGTILRIALERATSVWTVTDLDFDHGLDEGEDPLVLGAALVAYPALVSVVFDALRRWAIELPAMAVGVGPSAIAPRRARPSRGAEADEGLPPDPTRLALLAWLGHPGAARRMEAAPAPTDLAAWARGLARFGAAVCGRAALAAARAALDALEERGAATSSRLPPGPGRSLTTLEAWLDRPGVTEADAARAALDARVDAMCGSSGTDAKAEEVAALALELALATDDRLGDASAATQQACAEVVGPGALRRAIARALVPMLLVEPDGP